MTEIVIVERLGAKGDGVAEGPHGRFYVPLAAPGDRLEIRPGPQRGDGRTAEIVKILAPSADRATPPCRHFGVCGGCAVQHISTEAVAAEKSRLLTETLGRKGLGDVPVGDTVSIGPRLRRRMRFAAVRTAKDWTVGLNARESRTVVALSVCPVAHPDIEALMRHLPALMKALPAAGKAADLQVTRMDNGLDLTVAPVRPAPLGLADREGAAAFAEQHDLARLAWEGPDGIEPVAARRLPEIRFAGRAVHPPAGAFLQPSREGERAIADIAMRATAGSGSIADLYAGCGSLTFPLAAGGATVHAVEGDADMAAALVRAAEGLPVTAERRDLAKRPLTVSELARFDAVLFDPPRAGAAPQARALAASRVPVVVAVSCNPATLARDLRHLVDGGYTVERVTPIDQFTWSAHIEAVAVLRRA